MISIMGITDNIKMTASVQRSIAARKLPRITNHVNVSDLEAIVNSSAARSKSQALQLLAPVSFERAKPKQQLAPGCSEGTLPQNLAKNQRMISQSDGAASTKQLGDVTMTEFYDQLRAYASGNERTSHLLVSPAPRQAPPSTIVKPENLTSRELPTRTSPRS